MKKNMLFAVVVIGLATQTISAESFTEKLQRIFFGNKKKAAMTVGVLAYFAGCATPGLTRKAGTKFGDISDSIKKGRLERDTKTVIHSSAPIVGTN